MAMVISMLKKLDRTGVPLLLARVIVGGLFVWMGYKKIVEPVEFLKLIRMYGMMPESPPFYLNATAVALPWLEVFAGLGLLFGVMIRGSALMIAGMLAVFTPVIFLRALTMMSAENIPFSQVAFDCGCGSGVVIIWQKLLSNTALLIGSLWALFSSSRFLCLSALFRGRPKDAPVFSSSPPTGRPPRADLSPSPEAAGARS